MSAPAAALGAVPWRRDARIIGLVSVAHLLSHFFQILLAPLFPWLRAEFGWSYTELGFIVSVMFVVSGAGQAAAGFVVDRYGALRTLLAGLLCLAAAATCFGVARSYGTFVLGAVFAGCGNAVFHPVDFWILNHRVSEPRLGPAFSAHGLSGSLGWALAPLFLVGIASIAGWRSALFAAAALPLALVVLVVVARTELASPPASASASAPTTPARAGTGLAFLRLPALWWCFGFFVCIAAALGGVQSYAPTVFGEVYGLGRADAVFSVTVYMLASAAGMLAGGWLVARSPRLERNIALALFGASVAAALIGLALLPALAALALMAVMGFGSGLSGPSRDMLIRSAAPPGATGRVYGVVYSGLDAGIALAPVALGRLLDHGAVGQVYLCIAASLLAGVAIALHLGRLTARS